VSRRVRWNLSLTVCSYASVIKKNSLTVDLLIYHDRSSVVRTRFRVKVSKLRFVTLLNSHVKVQTSTRTISVGARHHILGLFSPQVHGIKTKCVTHSQCDARPTVNFPASERHCPATSTRLNYTAWWQSQVCVSGLPRAVLDTKRRRSTARLSSRTAATQQSHRN